MFQFPFEKKSHKILLLLLLLLLKLSECFTSAIDVTNIILIYLI